MKKGINGAHREIRSRISVEFLHSDRVNNQVERFLVLLDMSFELILERRSGVVEHLYRRREGLNEFTRSGRAGGVYLVAVSCSDLYGIGTDSTTSAVLSQQTKE